MSVASQIAKLKKDLPANCPGWMIVQLGDKPPEIPEICSRCGRPNDHATILRITEEIITRDEDGNLVRRGKNCEPVKDDVVTVSTSAGANDEGR